MISWRNWIAYVFASLHGLGKWRVTPLTMNNSLMNSIMLHVDPLQYCSGFWCRGPGFMARRGPRLNYHRCSGKWCKAIEVWNYLPCDGGLSSGGLMGVLGECAVLFILLVLCPLYPSGDCPNPALFGVYIFTVVDSFIVNLRTSHWSFVLVRFRFVGDPFCVMYC